MIVHTLARLALASSLVIAAACGGSTSSVDPGEPSAPGSISGGSGSGAEDPGGPRLTLALRGSTTPVTHGDAFSGQTPIRQVVAIRSLWLYKSSADPSPLRVLDLGAKSVEADLVTGVTSDIGRVALKSLPAGTYTLAKVGTAYVRYSVASRMHSAMTADGRHGHPQTFASEFHPLVGAMVHQFTFSQALHRGGHRSGRHPEVLGQCPGMRVRTTLGEPIDGFERFTLGLGENDIHGCGAAT